MWKQWEYNNNIELYVNWAGHTTERHLKYHVTEQYYQVNKSHNKRRQNDHMVDSKSITHGCYS